MGKEDRKERRGERREKRREFVRNIFNKEKISEEQSEALEQAISQLEDEYGDGKTDLVLASYGDREDFRDVLRGLTEGQEQYERSFSDLKKFFSQEQGTIRKSGIEEKISSLEDVEKVEDLSKLPVFTLLELEKNHEGILLYAFTDFIDGDSKFDIESFDELYREPKSGTKLQISFRGNQGAETGIGAADIFPPSVQKITVYSDGDMRRARTSKRRIGLKGKVTGGGGFYDMNGYIPIFTDDVVKIGRVDKKFEKKFRKEDGSLDFEAYRSDEKIQKAEKKFIDTLPVYAQKGRQVTSGELDALMDNVETSGSGKKVVEAVIDAIQSNMRCEHCWDWVNKIYKKVGVKEHRIFMDLGYWGPDCGEHHAPESMLDRIRPGDWLYINNHNSVSKRGNHSAIFIKWIDEDRRIAQVAGSQAGNVRGKIGNYDLKKNPVTYISKPMG